LPDNDAESQVAVARTVPVQLARTGAARTGVASTETGRAQVPRDHIRRDPAARASASAPVRASCLVGASGPAPSPAPSLVPASGAAPAAPVRGHTVRGHTVRGHAVRGPAERGQAAPASLRLTMRGRIVVAVAAALLVSLLSLLATGAAAQATGHAEPARVADRNLTQVVVRPGQSLWSVAENADPNADPQSVMQQIIELNGLTSDVIQAGQELWVPRG
jgi:LysM domain